MLRKLLAKTIVLGVVLSVFAFNANCQVTTGTPGPLVQAADLLERMYGKPVTYEDPVLLWKGDTEPVPFAKGYFGMVPLRRSFLMPVEADPGVTPVLDLALLNKVIDAYQKQINEARFMVSESAWGFHLIPLQVEGVDERSLLDVSITVPSAKRTPAEHLREICSAVTDATGVRLEDPAMYVNERFTPSNVKVKKAYRFIVPEDYEKISFEWGASSLSARQAILSLFEHSSTTLTWRLLCDPGTFCVFNVLPVEVYFTDSNGQQSWRALEHDREGLRQR